MKTLIPNRLHCFWMPCGWVENHDAKYEIWTRRTCCGQVKAVPACEKHTLDLRAKGLLKEVPCHACPRTGCWEIFRVTDLVIPRVRFQFT